MSGFLKAGYGKEGSVLVEVLLAVMILGVGITWVIQSMVASLRVSRQSPDYTTALILLENEMTRLMREKTIVSDFAEQKHFPAPDDPYTCSLTARPAPGDEDGGINEVTAAISWKSGRRNNKIILKTFLLNAS
jgi:Tfp pilus assembly protein PilV